MPSQSSNRSAKTLELAIGQATYDKLPLAIRVGAKESVETGELEYSLEFIEPSTGTYWNAMSRFIVDRVTGNWIVQFWDERDTGREAEFDLVQQQAISLSAFGSFPSTIGTRIFIQAIEWINLEV